MAAAMLVSTAVLTCAAVATAQPLMSPAQAESGAVATPAVEPAEGVPAAKPQEAAVTRAALARQLRLAKSADLHPRQRSGLESTLNTVETDFVLPRIFQGWHGVGLAAGEFPAGAGFGLGLGFRDAAVGSLYPRDDLPDRVDISMHAAKTTRGYTDLRAEFGLLNVGGSRLGFRLRAAYFEWKQMPFFGRGQNSRKDLESNFRFDSGEVGGEVVWRPGNLELSSGAFFLTPEIAAGESSEFPSFDQIFDRTAVPGAEAQPDFLRYDAGIAYDGRPTHRDWTAFAGPGGGYYGIKYSFYDDRDLGRYDFHRVEIEAQQHIPVKWRRAIVLRANAVFTDTTGDNVVPFYYQPTLGGQSMLRSFPEYRFYDDNRLLFTGEYRWAAWSALNMALFVDLGKVYPDSESLSLDDLESSYGFGFRFKSAFGFLARVDLAFGDEGMRTVAVWESVF